LANYAELSLRCKHFEIYDFFKVVFDRLTTIKGSVVECGFGAGNSFIALGALSLKSGRSLIGMDTFEGFPEPSDWDHSKRAVKAGEWAVRTLAEATRTCCLAGLEVAIRNGQIRLLQTTLGTQTLNPIPSSRIALLHLDVDLHDGYAAGLRLFWDQLAEGGIVVLDEYHSPKWPGCAVAVDNFISTRSDVVREEIVVANRSRYALKKRQRV
jgi:hypothetical protein